MTTPTDKPRYYLDQPIAAAAQPISQESVQAMCDELAAIAVAVGRSKDGTGRDVDWFHLAGEVRERLTPSAVRAIEPQNLTLARERDEALAQRDYWKRTAESLTPSATRPIGADCGTEKIPAELAPEQFRDATPTQKSGMFEWLRGQALTPGNPDWFHAGLAMHELCRLHQEIEKLNDLLHLTRTP